jgi:hypothetical protein
MNAIENKIRIGREIDDQDHRLEWPGSCGEEDFEENLVAIRQRMKHIDYTASMAPKANSRILEPESHYFARLFQVTYSLGSVSGWADRMGRVQDLS